MNGKISSLDKDELKINLREFEIHSLNKILDLYDVHIGGVADGNVSIASITRIPKISSDLNIRNFNFYNDTLGNGSFKINFNTSEKTIIH